MIVRLERAVRTLYDKDFNLLRSNVSERALCGKLATYLQADFPGCYVDVEYNQHGMDPKRFKMDPEGTIRTYIPI